MKYIANFPNIDNRKIEVTTKERRYLDYLEECREKDFEPTIGDICKACRTTPWTLLGKTQPSLIMKLGMENDM